MKKKMHIWDDSEFEKHECTSERQGDWIVFSCSKCDFIRRFHIETGEMRTEGGQFNVLHNGMHIPVGIQPELISMN